MERSMVEVASALSARGHAMTVMYRNPGEYLPLYEAAGCTAVHGFEFSLDPVAPVRSAGRFAATVARGASARPDLVYLNDYQHLPFGALVSAVRRVPLVAHLRINPPQNWARQLRASAPRADRFIAVSDNIRERFTTFGFPADRIDVVYNGVDPDRYSPGSESVRTQARHALGIAPDEIVVLYVGRLDAIKGVEVLIAAVNELHERDQRFRLVVAGGPAWHGTPAAAARYVDALKRAAAPCRAVFVGLQLDVVPLYRAADIVAVPTLIPEAFGRVVIEAMACRTPVIASRVGGIPEILTGEFAEFLVEPGDVAGLAERLATHAPRAAEVGVRCREEVIRRFNLDATIDGINEVFTRVTA
jgi:glycosyltransferase involved in cell wall biosynthesis